MQEIKLLFDNNLTLLYSVMMSLWAVIYLELWKRYSALLTHRWGVMFYSPEEEQPRPEYLAGKNIETFKQFFMLEIVELMPIATFWTNSPPNREG